MIRMNLPALRGIQHGLNDACAGLLAGSWLMSFSTDKTLLLLLGYNLIAFFCQPLASLIPEKHRRIYINLSMLLAASSLIVTENMAWIAMLLIATASCLFHVCAGAEVLQESRNCCAKTGVFVAPGVLGLLSGMAAGIIHLEVVSWLLIIMIIASLGLNIKRPEPMQTGKAHTSEAPGSFWIICVLLFLIALRSLTWVFYQGSELVTVNNLVILAVIISFGKLTGGRMGNHSRWPLICILTLGLATTLLYLSEQYASFALLAAGLALLQSMSPVFLVKLNAYLQKPALSSALALGTAISFGGALFWLTQEFIPSAFEFFWLLPLSLALLFLMDRKNRVAHKQQP
ncbi:hypothetical protein EOPP23_05650 [Endozoicomonas sp. OPT23]|uniref:hypothetical protein n=1 Tax=Endozoicomonas sp. OPT23 TaxID=2072845 RepID=UPI00129B3DF1|nr:hypothetical protein [Endozoicomonas sp. OPT23]MRI32469.1 hypothetical protein [Endozoicomonas sp. OPT23]